MKKSFWNNNHELSAENDRLWGKYVPSMGESKFLETELFRALSRLAYDWYNNGWGCNNKTPELFFLHEYEYCLAIEDFHLIDQSGAKFEAYMDNELVKIIKRIQKAEEDNTFYTGFKSMDSFGISGNAWDTLLAQYSGEDEDEEW